MRHVLVYCILAADGVDEIVAFRLPIQYKYKAVIHWMKTSAHAQRRTPDVGGGDADNQMDPVICNRDRLKKLIWELLECEQV